MTRENKPQLVEFTPRPFGRYYLIDKMAIGGMAEVFKAVFLGLRGFEMHLVIKRILPNLSANQDFVEMFVKEAKICVELRHHNIVQIYDFSQFREHYFIAMELVDGKDLKQFLLRLAEQKRHLSTECAAFIAHEICKGLEYAHQKKGRNGDPLDVVHRDLTPANILLSYSGEVKIADFGIAKAKINAKITKTGTLKGKYEYMSPEQARGEEVDSRSDIFAVGILLHEMLTGRRLFKTESDLETLEVVKSCNIQEPIAINPRISPRLNQIVMRCLHPSKTARFQRAKGLQLALLNCLRPIPLASLEEQLSETLSDSFKQNREKEERKEQKNKQHAITLKNELDNLEEDDGILLLPTDSGRHGTDKKYLWFLGLLVSIVILFFQFSTTPPKEVIINRNPPTQLHVTIKPDNVLGTLLLNGEEQGDGSLFLIEHVTPTKTTIRYDVGDQNERYLNWKEEIEIKANETTRVFIHLEEK
jgi:serine/threonine protein kinase